MPSSTRHALPSPTSTNSPDVPVYIKNLADAVDLKLPYISTSEPAKTAGLVWRNPTTGLVQITDGTSWFPITPTLWTAYTPAWTASGTAPVLGNGTLAGSWTKAGRCVTARVNFLPGSTTTFGTGVWSFSLPATAATVTGFSGFPIWLGSAYGFKSGVANRAGVARILSAGSTATITSHDGPAQWDSTIPHAWGNGDMLAFQITYESAS